MMTMITTKKSRPSSSKALSRPRWGGRITDDKFTKDELMMAEARFRLELYHEPETSKFTTKLAFRSDFVIDGITGQTTIDVREASAYVNLGIVDFKVGRQVMTWGVGDCGLSTTSFPKTGSPFSSAAIPSIS
jgi:hypothetical protein